jgi:nitrate reductase gamma subunit
MAIVYIFKIRWILKFPAGKERQKTTSHTDMNAKKGSLQSLLSVATPWALSSYRDHPWMYVQFVVFHVAVAVSIAMSVIMPYWPHLIESPVAVLALQIIFAGGLVVGLLRLWRRRRNPHVRAITTPDDYFSLALLCVWMVFSILAAPNNRAVSETPLLAYFFLTAFFLIYVPFSKISHYIYYPFARYYLGRTLGHRGSYSMMRPAAQPRS